MEGRHSSRIESGVCRWMIEAKCVEEDRFIKHQRKSRIKDMDKPKRKKNGKKR